MPIPKGLLVAGGIGALAIGGFMLFKGDKPEGGADPASKDVDPAAAGTGAGAPATADAPGTASPTAGTPAGGVPGSADAQGNVSSSSGGLQGKQVGPYTVVPDPQSGMNIVFETATQQPVGVLDAQGNMTPITVDANGKMTLAPNAGTPTPGVDPRAGSTASSPMSPTTGTSQASTGAQYRQLAEDLFANAGDGSAGSAASSAMTGATTLGASTLGASTSGTSVPPGYASTPPMTTTATTASSGSRLASIPGAQTVGKYTVVPDPQSGANLVFDTASEQPVGVLDGQGQLIPIEELQARAGANNAATGARSLAPAPYGSTAPPSTGSTPIGAGSSGTSSTLLR